MNDHECNNFWFALLMMVWLERVPHIKSLFMVALAALICASLLELQLFLAQSKRERFLAKHKKFVVISEGPYTCEQCFKKQDKLSPMFFIVDDYSSGRGHVGCIECAMQKAAAVKGRGSR